jgi:hypothetical protein
MLRTQPRPLHGSCCCASFQAGEIIEEEDRFEYLSVRPQDLGLGLFRRLLRTICGMANSQGGCILMGMLSHPCGIEVTGLVLD